MTETANRRNYELAYYLSANIDEAELPGAAEKIRKMISENDGLVISEIPPERRKIGQMIKRFSFGYFGVFQFQLEPEKIENLNRGLKMEPMILRAMVTSKIQKAIKPKKKKVPAATAAPAAAPKAAPRPAIAPEMNAPERPAPKPEIKPKHERLEPEKEKIKMEELNKKLEEILGE